MVDKITKVYEQRNETVSNYRYNCPHQQHYAPNTGDAPHKCTAAPIRSIIISVNYGDFANPLYIKALKSWHEFSLSLANPVVNRLTSYFNN